MNARATSDGIADLAGGMDTARSGATVEEREARAVNQRWARDYITRTRPDDADELLDILGLADPPPRDPGVCGCGAVLPITSASSGAHDDYGPGRCFACTRQERMPAPTSANRRLYPTKTRLALLEAAAEGRLILDGSGNVRLG